MSSLPGIVFTMICYFLLAQNGIVATIWKLSKGNDAEVLRSQKLFDKHTLKTIQEKANLLREEDKTRIHLQSSLGIGTTHNKRTTKQDLIREKSASSRISFSIKYPYDGPHYATCHTIDGEQGPLKYKGAEAIISIHNPSVSGKQYSGARLKLVMNDENTIEAGWRVDPSLYGDTKTRLYVYTRAGQARCFNTMCPGFVALIRPNATFDKISTRGGPIYDMLFRIIYEEKRGSWILQVGKNFTEVGYWPKFIFSTMDLPNYVEWGGETFNPSDASRPPMGSGTILERDSYRDAYMANMKIVKENGKVEDPVTKSYVSDSDVYAVKVEGHADDEFEYLMYYGGPGRVY